jgi:LacI family transcriptional regulator
VVTAGHRRYGAPTIRDVADRAGVAPGTVSNVLTGNRPVTESLRQIVLEAVAALGYEPNYLAASLRLNRSRSVGVVVPDLTNPFFSLLVRSIEDCAARDGYEILLVDSNEESAREAFRVRALLSRRIDGLIIAPTRDNVSRIGVNHAAPPTVLIDRGLDADAFDSVGVDNVAASRLGCEHLLELGHTDIALLVTDLAIANVRDRVEGYRAALSAAGLVDRERIIVGSVSVEGIRAAVVDTLQASPRPTAIFATAYVGTLGALQAIHTCGLALPDQISLLGFDDFDWMTLLRPQISTLRQPIEDMANNAWRLLLDRSDGQAAEPSRVRLPCTLQVRDSTRPPTGEPSGGFQQREVRQ